MKAGNIESARFLDVRRHPKIKLFCRFLKWQSNPQIHGLRWRWLSEFVFLKLRGVFFLCRKPSMGTWKLLQSLQILAMLEWLGLKWQQTSCIQEIWDVFILTLWILKIPCLFLDVGKQTAGFSMSWKSWNVVLATSWSIQVGILQWKHVCWRGICQRIL